MKKLCLMFLGSMSTTLLMHAANTPMPAVNPQPKQIVAQTTVAAKTAPVVITPAPKVITPTPLATAKTGPVDTPIAAAKGSAKSTTVTTPATSAINPATTKLPVQINIKNTSNFAAHLTGFTIIHKDTIGNRHALSQTVSNTKFKIYPASAKKILPIAFNLKAVPGTFFVGTSAIFINNQQISTTFKNEPWNSGMTDAIYITSTDGTTWTMDLKAMNAAYQKPLKPTKIKEISSAGKVTSVTKAATVPIVQRELEQQPVKPKTQPAPKSSKAAKASAKAVAKTTVKQPIIT